MVLIWGPVRLRLVHRPRFDMHPSFLQVLSSLQSPRLLLFSTNSYKSSHPDSHMVMARADWEEAPRDPYTRILLINNLVMSEMSLQYHL